MIRPSPSFLRGLARTESEDNLGEHHNLTISDKL